MEQNTDPKIAGKKLFVESTIREQFAAIAMQGLCSNNHYLQDASCEHEDFEEVARLSVILADALIVELNK